MDQQAVESAPRALSISISLTPDLLEKLDAIALDVRRSRSSAVQRMIDQATDPRVSR